MSPAPGSRAGFALSAVVGLLALILIGIVFWKVTFQLDLIPAAHPRAPAARSKAITSGIFTVLGSIAIAGGVGAAAYFCFGRSQKASNIGMSVAMAFPVALLTIQAWKTMTGPRPTQPAAPASAPSFGNSLSEQRKQEAERNRLAARAPPSTAPPSAPQPPRSPSPAPTGHPAPSATRPAPAQPPSSPRRTDIANPNVTRALDSLKTAVEEDIARTIDSLTPVLTSLAKPPRPDRALLRKRIDETKAAHESAAKLRARLRALTDEARAAAESAGSEQGLSAAMQFTSAFDASQRAFACDSLARILEQGQQESELLLDNVGLWKLGRDGKVESKEFQVSSRAHSARFFIESGLKSSSDDLARLRAK